MGMTGPFFQLEVILESLKQRFTDSPGIINTFGVLNLKVFPSRDELKGTCFEIPLNPTLCQLVSSAYNFCNQFGSRLGPTKHGV